MDFSRRQLISALACAVAFRNETLAELSKLTVEGHPDPTDEAYWHRFRSAFYMHPSLTVFNYVGVNSPPKVVEEAMARESRRAAADPSYVMWREQDHEVEAIRKDLAEIIGFDPSEVAVVPNATYGLHTVIGGVPMQSGEEILMTSQEYPRGFTAAEQRKRRFGTAVTTVDIGGTPLTMADMSGRILSQAGAKTRLAVVSQVTFLLGQKAPIADLSVSFAERKIPFLVDGAQSIALMPLKCKPEFFVASLHKWMLGPVGTGVLAVRKDWIDKVWPINPADPELDGSIQRFEQRGTHPTAPFLALKESIEIHHRLGADTKLARLIHLRAEIIRRLEAVPEITFLSSPDPAIFAPFLTLTIKGWNPNQIAGQLLQKHRIHVTTANRQGVSGVRISPNLFTNMNEIERLASALRDFAKSPPVTI